MLRFSLHVLAYVSGCGSNDNSVFRDLTLLFCSAWFMCTVGIPCFLLVLPKEREMVSQVWPPGISWWRMGISGQWEWRHFPSWFVMTGSPLSVGDGEWSPECLLSCDMISLQVLPSYPIPYISGFLVFLDHVERSQDQDQQGKRVFTFSGTPEQCPLLALPGRKWCFKPSSHSVKENSGPAWNAFCS